MEDKERACQPSYTHQRSVGYIDTYQLLMPLAQGIGFDKKKLIKAISELY